MKEEYIKVTLYLKRETSYSNGKFLFHIDSSPRISDIDVVVYHTLSFEDAAKSYIPSEVDKGITERIEQWKDY